MRTSQLLVFALLFSSGPLVRESAAAGPKEILQKAITAHGGKDKLEKFRAARVQGKGMLELKGVSVPFTIEAVSMYPMKLKQALKLELGGRRIEQVMIVDEKEITLYLNGMKQDLAPKTKQALLDSAYLDSIPGRLLIDDRDFELQAVPDAQIAGRAAAGVRVTAKERGQVTLYYDKETGRLAKTERTDVDANTLKKYTQTKVLANYKETDGIATPWQEILSRDGERFIELEITSIKHLERVEDREFQP